MRAVRVTFNNGYNLETAINGTDQELKEYYAIGQEFNIGAGEDDLMARVIKMEILT
jgi:hypothetical protein